MGSEMLTFRSAVIATALLVAVVPSTAAAAVDGDDAVRDLAQTAAELVAEEHALLQSTTDGSAPATAAGSARRPRSANAAARTRSAGPEVRITGSRYHPSRPERHPWGARVGRADGGPGRGPVGHGSGPRTARRAGRLRGRHDEA